MRDPHKLLPPKCISLRMKQSRTLKIIQSLQMNTEFKWMDPSHPFIKWKSAHILGEVSTSSHDRERRLHPRFLSPFPPWPVAILSNSTSRPEQLWHHLKLGLLRARPPHWPQSHWEGAPPTFLPCQWVAILLALWRCPWFYTIISSSFHYLKC